MALLDEYAGKHALKVWAYCLMTNHVHFVAVPGRGRRRRDCVCYTCPEAPGRMTRAAVSSGGQHVVICPEESILTTTDPTDTVPGDCRAEVAAILGA